MAETSGAGQTTILVSSSETRLIILLLGCASFAIPFNNLIISPLLVDIADEFSVTVGVAGLLITGYALPSAIFAFFVGPLIDYLGRRPIIVCSLLILGSAAVLSAFAPNFPTLMAMRALAGVGVAGLMPAVFTTVGDYFPYQERGRALGWVITANTAAGVVGVPLGAVVAGVFSWRVTFAALGIITLCVAFIFWRLFPRADRAKQRFAGLIAQRRLYRRVLTDRSVVAAVLSNLMDSLYWFAWITFMGAFYKTSFGLSTGQVAPVMSTLGVGVLIGSNIGGRLSDRTTKKAVVRVAGMLTALFIALQTNVLVGAWLAALLNIAFTIPGGARFTSVTALLTELAPEARGTVMSVNASALGFGIMSGAAIGGLVVNGPGFAALGLLCAAISLCSTAVFQLFVTERRYTAVPLAAQGAVAADPPFEESR